MNKKKTIPPGWEKLPLGEVITLKYGSSLPEKQRVPGKYYVYGSNGKVGTHNDSITKGQTIIVGRKGSIGKIHFSQEPCFPIDTTYYIDETKKECNIRWLTYQLKQINLERLNRAAAVPGLNRNDVYRIKILFPPLETQNRIVSVLERAERLRTLRAEADGLADSFLRNVFLEMFGDPVLNPKFEVVKLKNLYSTDVKGARCGPFGSALKKDEYVEKGIPVWTMDNITENEFIDAGCLYITKEKFQELSSYSVNKGDIIISRAGTVGKMCVVDSNINPSIISTNIIRLSLDKSKIEPIFFTSLMTYFKGRVGRLKTGSDGAYTFMNTGALNELKIHLPPIELQKEFSKIVEKTKKMKNNQANSAKEINNFFNSLMHRSFQGDL